MFQSSQYYLRTRLLSNVVFMLLKDQNLIYRMYHNHILEVLDRFHTYTNEESQLAFVMYENFVKLTEALKSKGARLIKMFNFPITLPDNMYNPNAELMEELRQLVQFEDQESPSPLLIESRIDGNAQDVAAKLKHGMEPQDEQSYFDFSILQKMHDASDEEEDDPKKESLHLDETTPGLEQFMLRDEQNMSAIEIDKSLDLFADFKQLAPQNANQEEEKEAQAADQDYSNYFDAFPVQLLTANNEDKEKSPLPQDFFFTYNQQHELSGDKLR